MTITSKYASKCQCCNKAIAPGDQINWVKGVKGVTCASCPAPGGAPATSTPVAASDAALLAALSDGQALCARIGEQEAEIARLRAVLVEARSAITQAVNERDEARQVAAARRMGPGAAVIAHVLRPDPAYPAVTDDDDCPI